MKLTEEQRQTLIDALIEDMVLSIGEDWKFREAFLRETLEFGRVGYQEYTDQELLIACNDANLGEALEEAGVIE